MSRIYAALLNTITAWLVYHVERMLRLEGWVSRDYMYRKIALLQQTLFQHQGRTLLIECSILEEKDLG